MSRLLVMGVLIFAVTRALAQTPTVPAQTGAGSGSGSGSDTGSGADSGSAAGDGSGSAEPPKPDPKKTFDDFSDDTSSFDKLKTPTSPAFTILGVAPTEIQRPSTPKAVAVALGEFVSGDSLAVPKNFSLEVSPFWLFSHPELTLQKYQDEHALRWLRTFSLSIGSSQTARSVVDAMGASTDHTDSDVAVGVRSVLYQSEFSKKCMEAVEQYAVAVAESVMLTPAELEQLTTQYGKGTPEFKSAAAALQEKKYNSALEKAAESTKQLLTSPKCITDGTLVRGWTVDVAAAVDWLALDSKLTAEATSWHRAGAWFNVARDAKKLAFAMMGRFAAEKAMTTQKVLDGGARGFYKGTNFAVSAELIYRYRVGADEDKSTFKTDVAVDYKISDDTWLSISFGKDFAFAPGDVGSLFTLANVQWNLGTPTIGK